MATAPCRRRARRRASVAHTSPTETRRERRRCQPRAPARASSPMASDPRLLSPLFPLRPSLCPRAMPRPTRTQAACRTSPVPCPNHALASARRLPGQTVAFDLLVQIRPRHIQRPRRLRHVPIEGTELREQERALRGVLELLEGLALEQRPEPGLIGIALADEPLDVLAGDARPRRQNEQPLDGVAELANVAGPFEPGETLDGVGRYGARSHAFLARQLPDE